MESTYHQNYDSFETDNFVGCLTIDRQALRTEMYTLYKNPDAVMTILPSAMEMGFMVTTEVKFLGLEDQISWAAFCRK